MNYNGFIRNHQPLTPDFNDEPRPEDFSHTCLACEQGFCKGVAFDCDYFCAECYENGLHQQHYASLHPDELREILTQLTFIG